MSLVKNLMKSVILVFLMMNISNSYAKKQQSAERVEQAQAAISVEEAACLADEACDVATAVPEDEMYGGIKQEYVVKGCKVTIYNDGPVKMVDEKTDEPCDAPLPKDHQFSQEIRTYEEDGCMISEQVSVDGATDATMDCSKSTKRK